MSKGKSREKEEQQLEKQESDSKRGLDRTLKQTREHAPETASDEDINRVGMRAYISDADPAELWARDEQTSSEEQEKPR